MKIATTIQARMTSERLPGKILLPVLGKPLLEYMIERLKRIPSSQEIIVCTTTNAADDPVIALCDKLGVKHYRGSEDDVLSRVLEGVHAFDVDLIVETTGDCPLIDPVHAEKVIQKYCTGQFDYVSNILERTYPRGMETQVFSTKVLEEVDQATTHPADREHVSFYIYNHPEKYRLGCVKADDDITMPELRLTVDTEDDFELMKNIIEALYPQNPNFSIEDIMTYLKQNPKLMEINSHIEQKKVSYE